MAGKLRYEDLRIGGLRKAGSVQRIGKQIKNQNAKCKITIQNGSGFVVH
jgi:cytochrome c-type biogenesis protein CcmE